MNFLLLYIYSYIIIKLDSLYLKRTTFYYLNLGNKNNNSVVFSLLIETVLMANISSSS